MGKGRAGPEFLDHVEAFIHPVGAIFPGHAERGEFVRHETAGNADFGPAAGKLVERRQVFGHLQWVAQRQ